MSIKVENLTHTYMPGTPFQATAIKNVSFEIQQGEFVGIIGHTGSGKSTLIQHLNGLLKPDSGTVTVDGLTTTGEKSELKQIRRKVGLVFQYPEYQLFEETVEKDVGYGPGNMGFSEEEKARCVREAIEAVGLDYEAIKDQSPFDLSGGQKRRVAIAGILAMNPDIIVFDEPTAGLDPSGRELLFEKISYIQREMNKTVILISHSMDDVARLAHRLLVMEEGQLIFDGTPAEVFANREISRRLDKPQLTSIAEKLNATGKFCIPDGIFEVEAMAKAIADCLKGENNDQ